MKSKRLFWLLLVLMLPLFLAACGQAGAYTAEATPTPVQNNTGQRYLAARVTETAENLAVTEQTLPFHDVSSNAWFYPYVQFVYENDMMQGVAGDRFAADANFERAQVVATLFRLYHGRAADESDTRETVFTDVSESAWYAPYVAWGYDSQIVAGVGDGMFAPRTYVEREQLATILFRFANEVLDETDTTVRQTAQWNDFTDRNQVQSWAEDALAWANYHAIINGRTQTTLVPRGHTTRGEAAAMLTRFTQVPPPPKADVESENEQKQEQPPNTSGQTLCSVDELAAASVIQPTNISWYKQLFNQHNRVGSNFSPPSSRTLTGSHVSVDSRIYEPLNQMMASARAAGATIWAQSGYRPYQTQRNLFENRVSRYMNNGYSRAQAEQNTALWIAAPGTSEHQSGLAVDFNCITMAFEQTIAFQWLLENAHRYGFILRYPPGTTHITGVSYEPWHFRYVGVTHATKIWEYGVTLEQYIKWYFSL